MYLQDTIMHACDLLPGRNDIFLEARSPPDAWTNKAPFVSSIFLKYCGNTSVSKNNELLNTSSCLVPSNTVVLKTKVSQILKLF
jgi:hypothetical protein